MGMAEGQTVVLRKLAPARFSISIAPRSGVGAGASDAAPRSTPVARAGGSGAADVGRER